MDTAGGSCDQIQYLAICACMFVCVHVCVLEGDMMAWQRLNITFDRHQMPAGTDRTGVEGNGPNDSCYSFLSQHRRSLALREAHRTGFIQIHTDLQPNKQQKEDSG